MTKYPSLRQSNEPTSSHLEKKEYLVGNLEGRPENYSPQVVCWSTLQIRKDFQIERSMNIDHGIFMIKTNQNHNEYFGFATHKENFCQCKIT